MHHHRKRHEPNIEYHIGTTMNLFITYSRDERAWVTEFARVLRDRLYHAVWSDQMVLPASNWWDEILNQIEACEVLIYVMTPRAVESVYCQAELDYALRLGKLVLPLMLKEAKYPPSLANQWIQYYRITEDDTMNDVLLAVERALGQIRLSLSMGMYFVPTPRPTRPLEPKPRLIREDSFELFKRAEEAVTTNFQQTESLFNEIIQSNLGDLGLAAQQRLTELKFERQRASDYSLIETSATQAGAKSLWDVYVSKYGMEYDPAGLALRFETAKPKLSPIENRIKECLEGFEWIEIPAWKAQKIAEPKSLWDLIHNRRLDHPRFYIAKYPITNGQFLAFMQAEGYHIKAWWTEDGLAFKETLNMAMPALFNDPVFGQNDHPVVGVSWYEAIAFCNWLKSCTGETITLPTDTQWQRAAQGEQGWLYPWGNTWEVAYCQNSVTQPCASTSPVTSFLGKGDSPYKVVDLAGNVEEWCLTEYDSGTNTDKGRHRRVVRGGNWTHTKPADFSAETRSHTEIFANWSRRDNLGFRIVRNF
jgi:hypothetical protein